MNKDTKKYVLFVLSSIILIIIDQLSKYLVKTKVTDSIYIIKKVLCIDYVINRGAAWGVMQNKISMFLILTIIVLIAIIFAYIRCPKTCYYLPLRICICLLFAGAIGNMIDRAIRGYVIDFINFEIINFPVFNIADCYITVSTFALLILCIFKYTKDSDFDFLKIRK